MPGENYRKLLENESAAATVDIVGNWQTHYGGQGDFWVWGNLGGGTVYLEAALEEDAPCGICGTEITGTSPTSSGVAKFYLAASTRIRAVLKNSTSASSGVYARVNT